MQKIFTGCKRFLRRLASGSYPLKTDSTKTAGYTVVFYWPRFTCNKNSYSLHMPTVIHLSVGYVTGFFVEKEYGFDVLVLGFGITAVRWKDMYNGSHNKKEEE